jgi:(p)ppGpp synthase/HD superfamily hydrolase
METTATNRTVSSRLDAAFAAIRALDLPANAEPTRMDALGVAEIVRTLDADDEVVIAAMLQPLMDAKYLERETADKRFGEEATRLARALSQLGHFGLPTDWTPERGLEVGQAEALRKMLLAVIGDVRLVVVRLAEQLQKMRGAKTLDAANQSTRRSQIDWAYGRSNGNWKISRFAICSRPSTNTSRRP